MNGLKVRIWMMTKSIKSREIANAYGCSDSFVSKFLNGEKPSRGLVDYLVREGCPEAYFKNGKVSV